MARRVASSLVSCRPRRRRSPPLTPAARREEAINRGLAKRLQQLADERERRERAAGGRRRIHCRVLERGACGPFAASNRTHFPARAFGAFGVASRVTRP